MKVHINITDDIHARLKELKKRESRTFQYLITKAIENFLIAKHITAWDKLPKHKQETLKQKAKDLVK